MPLRIAAVGMHRERDAVAIVMQRGIGRHAAGAGNAQRDRDCRKFTQTGLRQAFRSARRERFSRALAEACAQVVEIARFGQHMPALRIHQPQIRAQMRFDARGIEIHCAQFNTAEFL